MQAFRDRKVRVIGLAGVSLTAAYLLSDRIEAIAYAPTNLSVHDQITAMRSSLPADQADGSVLEDITFDGHSVTLHLAGDGRLDLRAMRDGERDQKCATWRDALRSRQVAAVEYRYRQDGAVSSVFLDRSVCG